MNVTNLLSDTDFLCGSTSATYPVAAKIRNFNIAYQDVARTIWESQGGWQYDDSNSTTLPLAKTTMVHSQQDYSLPSTAQRLEGVIVKDKGGHWQKLKPFDPAELTIAPQEFLLTAGMPLYYNVVGRSVELYPKPSSAYATLASGLGVYVSRDVTDLPVTATTTEPGFPSAFHRILSYAASIDFVQDPQQRQLLVQQKDRLEKGLTRFYAKRSGEVPTQIRPAGKKRWRTYT